MSKDADRALNALFDAERETLSVAPHANPTYFALLDRLARGDAPAMDVPQGSSPLAGTGLGTTMAASTATLAVIAGIWGGSLVLDRGHVAGTQAGTHARTAPAASATIADEAPRPAPPAPIAVRADAHDAPAASAVDAPRADDSTHTTPTANAGAERDTARRMPASARAEDLAEELRLLSVARAAWKAGRGTDALARLDEHERRFPRGLLREDRAALEAVLLCGTGKLVAGRAKARRFLAQHPQSTLVDTVRSACP